MTPAMAKLIRLKTDDRMVEMHPNIPLGKLYRVDLDSVRDVRLYNVIYRKHHHKLIIDCLTERGNVDGWLAVEMLRIES